MTHEPLISVIVPVFNAMPYLEDCLDSILAQSYSNLEILIADDGSTDGSVDTAMKYEQIDSRIRVFQLPNRGPSAARNRALDEMTGEYVTFVDADDMISRDCIEILYMLLTETGADMSVSEFTHTPECLGLSNDRYETINATGYLADVLYQRYSDNSVCAKLYDAKLWDALRFRLMRYEDLEIFPRLCLKARLVTVTSARLYYYRMHEASFVNSFSSKRLDSIKATEMMYEYLVGTKCHDGIVSAVVSRHLAASFNVFLLTCGRPEYADVNHKAWSNIVDFRFRCLFDSKVILKIKLGILASMAGRRSLGVLNSILKLSR